LLVATLTISFLILGMFIAVRNLINVNKIED
jgi:hypothetical protein